jgi:hypothetical protein
MMIECSTQKEEELEEVRGDVLAHLTYLVRRKGEVILRLFAEQHSDEAHEFQRTGDHFSIFI